MHLGFCGMSVGVSLANVGDLYVAVLEHSRMYHLGGTGTGHSIVAGAFQSSPHGGVFLPDEDGEHRSFPDNLNGKQVRFQMEGLPTWGGEKRLTLLIQQPGPGPQSILYQWTGTVPIFSSLTFDYDIGATAAVCQQGPAFSVGSHISYQYLLWGERSRSSPLFQAPPAPCQRTMRGCHEPSRSSPLSQEH